MIHLFQELFHNSLDSRFNCFMIHLVYDSFHDSLGLWFDSLFTCFRTLLHKDFNLEWNASKFLKIILHHLKEKQPLGLLHIWLWNTDTDSVVNVIPSSHHYTAVTAHWKAASVSSAQGKGPESIFFYAFISGFLHYHYSECWTLSFLRFYFPNPR